MSNDLDDSIIFVSLFSVCFCESYADELNESKKEEINQLMDATAFIRITYNANLRLNFINMTNHVNLYVSGFFIMPNVQPYR